MKIETDWFINKFSGILDHFYGEVFSNSILSNPRKAGKPGKDIDIKTYEDNAILFSLLADVGETYYETYNPFSDKNKQILVKFSAILMETQENFRLTTNLMDTFMSLLRFLYLQCSKTGEVAKLKKWIRKQYSCHYPSKGNLTEAQENNMISMVKFQLAYPYMETVVNLYQADKDQAKKSLKGFMELDDEKRLTIYGPYLTKINLLNKKTSPMVIWANFLDYLFKQGKKEEEKGERGLIHKLIKRAEISLKLSAKHISVPVKKEEAKQWLAIPFIDMVKDMVTRDYEKAKLAIYHFCELPNNKTRLKVYGPIMSQPELLIDRTMRIIAEIIDQIKSEHEKAFNSCQNDQNKPIMSLFSEWANSFKQQACNKE